MSFVWFVDRVVLFILLRVVFAIVSKRQVLVSEELIRLVCCLLQILCAVQRLLLLRWNKLKRYQNLTVGLSELKGVGLVIKQNLLEPFFIHIYKLFSVEADQGFGDLHVLLLALVLCIEMIS